MRRRDTLKPYMRAWAFKRKSETKNPEIPPPILFRRPLRGTSNPNYIGSRRVDSSTGFRQNDN